MRITKLSGPAKAMPAADEFNAYYVPMVQTSDVATGNSHYVLPSNAQALDMMITSQLSGCTFGVGSAGNGAQMVSHVQPNNSITNTGQKATDLSQAVLGGFGQPAGTAAKGSSYEQYGAVIGRRTGAKWNFYIQATEKPTAFTYSIGSVAFVGH